MKQQYNRTKVNFYIDLILFLLLAALIGIGILIKYVLIPGQERWLLYGTNTELTFLGMDRHVWGTIHLITGILFFVLFILHLIFHWNMIKCMFRRCLPSKPGRVIVVSLSLVLFVGLVSFPVFVNPVKEPIDKGFGRIPLEEMGIDLNDSIRLELKKPKRLSTGEEEPAFEIHQKKHKPEIDITGKMTLKEVSEKYQVDIEILKDELGLPAHISGNEKLGRLKKRFNFSMDSLRMVVVKDWEK